MTEKIMTDSWGGKFVVHPCDCGGEFRVDDLEWRSRKRCTKCEEYIDLSQSDAR